MSRWQSLVNELKRSAQEQNLTPTQRAVRDCILDWMRFPGWINLFGDTGSGKTFVAWSLARANGSTYLPLPALLKELREQGNTLLIDNAPHEEAQVRRLLAQCDMANAPSVVIVTHQAITMPMRRIGLSLPNANDLEVVFKTLALRNYPCDHSQLKSNPNLWNILQACI